MIASTSALERRSPADTPDVVLTDVSSTTTTTCFRHDEGMLPLYNNGYSPPTSLAFGGKSRYLCVGNEGGTVCLWDLKKQVRARQYAHEGPSLQVNLTNQLVYSLAPNGLHIFQLKEGTLSATMAATQRDGYCQFQIAPSSKDSSNAATTSPPPLAAAIGTRQGTVELWDTTISNRSSVANPHNAMIHGLAFSSRNPKLLASIASSTLAFTNVTSGTTIDRIELRANGICLDYARDGITCAVGTTEGSVMVYDLRNTNEPYAQRNMNRASFIRSVRFSPTTATNPPATAKTKSLTSPYRNSRMATAQDGSVAGSGSVASRSFASPATARQAQEVQQPQELEHKSPRRRASSRAKRQHTPSMPRHDEGNSQLSTAADIKVCAHENAPDTMCVSDIPLYQAFDNRRRHCGTGKQRFRDNADTGSCSGPQRGHVTGSFSRPQREHVSIVTRTVGETSSNFSLSQYELADAHFFFSPSVS